MAQTRRRRRRKRRGTQGGSIDRRGRRVRPRSRAEARAQARSRGRAKRPARGERPPTWGGAIGRGLFGAAIFFVLLVIAFGRPLAEGIGLSAFMFLVYVPMGYFIELFFYRRRIAKRLRSGSD